MSERRYHVHDSLTPTRFPSETMAEGEAKALVESCYLGDEAEVIGLASPYHVRQYHCPGTANIYLGGDFSGWTSRTA